MNATAPPLDLFNLAPTLMLSTEQVASLGLFGARATLEHNRCVGRPGPKYIKLAGRVLYRVSDLTAYLAVQEAASEQQMAERRARYDRRARRPHAAKAVAPSADEDPFAPADELAAEGKPAPPAPPHPKRSLWCSPRSKESARADA